LEENTMTETNTIPEAESPVGEQTDLPEGNDPGEGQKGNREARYRVERNQAREERDTLAARLEQLQTAELHRLAGEFLSAPEDISLSGRALTDYLTPEGWVDRAAVEQAARAVVETRPGLAKNAAAVDPTQGRHGGTGKPEPTWAALLAP
jgi:hypothetical protein